MRRIQSRIDSNKFINEDEWAVTLIRIGLQHAELIIEGVGACIPKSPTYRWKADLLNPNYWGEFNGNYWTMCVHFTGSGETRYPAFLCESLKRSFFESRCANPKILVHNLTDIEEIKYDCKYKTEIISSDLARYGLLSEIQRDIESPPAFHLMGDESVFAQGIFGLLYQAWIRNVQEKGLKIFPNERSEKHSCITWAREKLRFARIILPVHNNDHFATRTSSYTG